MHNAIIKFIEIIGSMTNFIFGPLDSIIERIPMVYWVKDALKDSLHMVPFLFIVFLVIEFIEYFYSHKMSSLMEHSDKEGPFVGSILGALPQCGFSVVASTLYTNRLITMGTLIAVYLSTSDEAIPVMLAEPGNAFIVVRLIALKIAIGIIAGYLIDFFLKKKSAEAGKADDEEKEGCCGHHLGHCHSKKEIEKNEGCCDHHLNDNPNKKELLLHPIIHTANIFFFIFLVTLGINYLVSLVGGEQNLGKYFLHNSVFQPVITAFFGLIPNCAASVAIALMYLKGAIGFGSVVAGLCSSAGLGLLILLRRNEDIKDTLKIIGLLLLVSITSGLVIQFLYN